MEHKKAKKAKEMAESALRMMALEEQMVWEEMPSGRVFSNELTRALTNEWLEVLKRDRQHPCIIAWVPFNESWGVWHQSSRHEQ